MSDPLAPLDPQTRKTLSFTHKQVGMGAIVGAVLFALQPTLSHFQTKDVAEAKMQLVQAQLDAQSKFAAVQSHQADELRLAIRDVDANVKASKDEVITMLRRLADSTKQREEQAEIRQRITDDRQDRLIEAARIRNLNRSNN